MNHLTINDNDHDNNNECVVELNNQPINQRVTPATLQSLSINTYNVVDTVEEQNLIYKRHIDYLTTVIKNANIQDVDLEIPTSITNGWGSTTTDTLKQWIIQLTKSSFIAETVREIYQKRLNKILVYVLILTTFNTMISGISSALLAADITNIWVIFGFNVVILVVSSATAFLTGYVRIHKWDDFVRALTSFIERVDSLLGVVNSQSLLPFTVREDATEFIKTNNDVLIKILQEAPQISTGDYVSASTKFDSFIQRTDNNNKQFRFDMKYNKSLLKSAFNEQVDH